MHYNERSTMTKKERKRRADIKAFLAQPTKRAKDHPVSRSGYQTPWISESAARFKPSDFNKATN
jgi:hypothetical protein